MAHILTHETNWRHESEGLDLVVVVQFRYFPAEKGKTDEFGRPTEDPDIPEEYQFVKVVSAKCWSEMDGGCYITRDLHTLSTQEEEDLFNQVVQEYQHEPDDREVPEMGYEYSDFYCNVF